MDKDKRIRGIVGRAGRSATAESRNAVGPCAAEERYRRPIGGYDPGPNNTMAHGWFGGRGATRPTVVRRTTHFAMVTPLMYINK
jgi:hypothetical protein